MTWPSIIKNVVWTVAICAPVILGAAGLHWLMHRDATVPDRENTGV